MDLLLRGQEVNKAENEIRLASYTDHCQLLGRRVYQMGVEGRVSVRVTRPAKKKKALMWQCG